MPLTPGIIRSRTTRSYLPVRAISRPSAPPVAMSTDSPLADSARDTKSQILGSSSMTSTRAITRESSATTRTGMKGRVRNRSARTCNCAATGQESALPAGAKATKIRSMRAAATATSLAAVVALVFAAAAPAAVQRNRTVTPQQAAQPWTGVAGPGNNQGFNPQTATPCNANDPATRCDETLLNVNVAPSFWDTNGGGVEINVNGFSSPNDDFDLFVYTSNAAGDVGKFVTASAGGAGQNENVALQRASGFFLVVVVYFQVGNGDTYTGNAAFFTRSKFPPDVDSPPGLQEALASDPGRGFQSHSEPHIAQSPTNPNVLVAASKMYNLDPDALAEYEFKIGSYASFDGGQSWHDLGQINVCPPDQAPPSSWPNNTCYPADDPKVGGTGAEDANDPRGNTDFGEEYIVSDVWLQFDDEGNAYAIVLDSPEFPSGNGWGMTLHRWETPTPEDIAAGQTWSDRIPINAYPAAASDANFPLLDDKNTFGVNNAGPDGDGVSGVMVACWSLNDTSQGAALPQQV